MAEIPDPGFRDNPDKPAEESNPEHAVEADDSISPEAASAFLDHLGYTQDLWQEIINTGTANHEVRALIGIALGQTMSLASAYEEERSKDAVRGSVTEAHDSDLIIRDAKRINSWYKNRDKE